MFKAIGNYLTSAGWLLLPESLMAFDKQQHGIVAVFITIVTFFPSIGILNLGVVYAALISFLANALVAWGYEYAQKYNWLGITGDFDPYDALVMMLVNGILLALFAWRVISIGTATWM